MVAGVVDSNLRPAGVNCQRRFTFSDFTPEWRACPNEGKNEKVRILFQTNPTARWRKSNVGRKAYAQMLALSIGRDVRDPFAPTKKIKPPLVWSYFLGQ